MEIEHKEDARRGLLRLLFGTGDRLAFSSLGPCGCATLGGAALCGADCLDLGALLTKLGTRMQDGESVAEALRGLAGEQTE